MKLIALIALTALLGCGCTHNEPAKPVNITPITDSRTGKVMVKVTYSDGTTKIIEPGTKP